MAGMNPAYVPTRQTDAPSKTHWLYKCHADILYVKIWIRSEA